MMERCDEIRDDLIEFAEGALPPDAHRRVEAHLAWCAACTREAALLVETLTRARALPGPETPDAFWADFGATVRQRIAAETPPPQSFFLRLGTWGGRLSWLRPLPALGAAVAVGVLLAVGLVYTLRGPRDLPPAESLVVGDFLAIAQNLEALEHLDLAENLDLLEQMSILQAPELGRTHARS
jgi:anti-sigma factor RsiW